MYPYLTSEMVPNFAFALRTHAARIVDECAPHLRGDFPPFGQFDFQIGSDQNVSIIIMRFKDSGIPAGGEMERDEFTRLKSLASTARTYADGSVKNLGHYAGSWIACWPKRPSSTAALT